MSALNRHEIDRRILASSIDFEVELIAFAFVDRAEARAFHRADVHECVRLAVIAHEEAKALHRIEELDRPGRFFASQFALRRASLLNRDHFADNLQILCGDLATAIDQVELKLLTFRQPFKASALNRTDVDEDIFAAAFLLNEAEAFLAVEELHGAFAGANDLGGHAVEATASAAATARTAAATRAAKASPAAAIATTITAAETVTTASAITVTAATAKAVAATIISVITRGRESVTATKRIKSVFAESVALVPSAPTTPIVTHNSVRTLPPCPTSKTPMTWGSTPNQPQMFDRKNPETLIHHRQT